MKLISPPLVHVMPELGVETDHPSGRYYTSFNQHNWQLSRCFYDFIRIVISHSSKRSQEKTSKGVVNGTVIPPRLPRFSKNVFFLKAPNVVRLQRPWTPERFQCHDRMQQLGPFGGCNRSWQMSRFWLKFPEPKM